MAETNRDSAAHRQPATWGRGRAVRLDREMYEHDWAVHITLRAWRGAPFRGRAVAQMVCRALEETASRLAYELYAYCLMPDHLHVLLSPALSGTHLSVFLRRFKSFTTNRYWKLGGRGRLWQASARDRLMRSREKPSVLLSYIVGNPVRAGLVRAWTEWPYTRLFVEP